MSCKQFLKSTLLVLIFGLSLFSFTSNAAIDVYEFKDEEKQQRFQILVSELRCPKCQNQNLADSNAEIAKDLRTKVYQMIAKDKSDDAIVNYMLERYGEFVLYKPRLSGQTLLLWIAPFVLLILALLVVFFIIRQRQQRSVVNEPSSSKLDSQQQQKLAQLLNSQQEKNK